MIDEPGGAEPRRRRISGFVVTYNRQELVEACLRSLRFVDELVVVDKTSTDGTLDIVRRYADKVSVVPWTPTADDTRQYALELCSHDFIVYLDDDEILSRDAVRFILEEAEDPSADVYSLPFRTYFFGAFDERRRDWPEYHERVFVRGSLAFRSVIHGGVDLKSKRRRWIPADSSVCVHHLSVPTLAHWVEKVNRYTAQPERESWFGASAPLSADFVRQRLEYWLVDGKDGSYATAYALSRVVYDLIDRLKRWETERGLDGKVAFQDICARLLDEHGGPVSGPGSVPGSEVGAATRVVTWRGTELYLDGGSGLLRHRAIGTETDGAIVAERHGKTLRLVAEQRPSQAPSSYRLVEARVPWWSGFGLERDGLYLCAEPDGAVTLSRKVLSRWETFVASPP